MKKHGLIRIVGIIAAFLLWCWLPPAAFAQRGGGHGGGMGGGFHGGGMGGGFHSGGSFHGGGYGYSGGHGAVGAYRGGGYYAGRGYYGYRGGYGYGWRGGYGWGRYGWGYPRYGWGWGFGFGWPYWGWGWGYPYGYSYIPYYAPYPYDNSYPSDCPPGYTCTPNDDPNNDPPPPNSGPRGESNPTTPDRPADNPPNVNYEDDNGSAESGAPILSVDRISTTTSNATATRRVQPATFTAQTNSSLRPQVQHAIQELREMPPFARQREIETGRYSHFSAKERELLRQLE
jgi:hypothetical protein